MKIAADVLVALVAVFHVYVLVMEMFLWQTPRVRKSFGTTAEFAAQSATLAANQGLYNGFLAAGLLWGLLTGSFGVKVFFLACVIIAGLYGGATVNRRILVLQGGPAALALLSVILAG
jgi:putative membrane protein